MLKPFLQAIDENPKDKGYWGVLADFLEERGDNRSLGIRYLIKRNKEPILYPNVFKEWTWWRGSRPDEMGIPIKLWNLIVPEKPMVLPKSKWSNGTVCTEKNFHSLSSAIMAVADVYEVYNVKNSKRGTKKLAV